MLVFVVGWHKYLAEACCHWQSVGGDASNNVVTGECGDGPKRISIETPNKMVVGERLGILCEYSSHHREHVTRRCQIASDEPLCPESSHFANVSCPIRTNNAVCNSNLGSNHHSGLGPSWEGVAGRDSVGRPARDTLARSQQARSIIDARRPSPVSTSARTAFTSPHTFSMRTRRRAAEGSLPLASAEASS